MILHRLSAAAVAIATTIPSAAFATDNPLCRQIGHDWTWFGDHVALSIDYRVAGPTGRQYEIGTGVSFNGKPLGSKSTHEGAYEVTAYGAGAIHIRQKDDGAPFDICVWAGDMRLIEVCGKYRLDCTF